VVRDRATGTLVLRGRALDQGPFGLPSMDLSLFIAYSLRWNSADVASQKALCGRFSLQITPVGSEN
jgi:hypothetical protein